MRELPGECCLVSNLSQGVNAYNKHDVCRVAASPANTNNKNEYSCPALTLPWRGYGGFFPDVVSG